MLNKVMSEDSLSYELVNEGEEEEDDDDENSVYTYAASDDGADERVNELDDAVTEQNEESHLSRNDAHEEPPPEATVSQQQVVFELPAGLLEPNLNNSVDGGTEDIAARTNSNHEQGSVRDSVSTASESYASSAVLHIVSTILREPELPYPALALPHGSNASEEGTHDSNPRVAEEPVAPTSSYSGTALAPRNWDGDDESWSNVSASSVHPSYSTWNSISAARSEQDDDGRSYAGDASSTISGFEYISLNGSSQRRCKRCTLLNRDVDGWCDGCGLALVVNPCFDMDQQIAVNLRHKEECEAYECLQLQERKRHLLVEQPLLVQSQALTDEMQKHITKFLRCNSQWNGILGVPKNHMVILASRLLEYVLSQCHQRRPPGIQVVYCFSKKVVGANCMSWIHQEGFSLDTKYSTNIKAAYHSASIQHKIHDTKNIAAMENEEDATTTLLSPQAMEACSATLLSCSKMQPHERNRTQFSQHTIEEETETCDDDDDGGSMDVQCGTKVYKEVGESDFLGWIALVTASDNDTYEGWTDDNANGHETSTNQDNTNQLENGQATMDNTVHVSDTIGEGQTSPTPSTIENPQSINDNLYSGDEEEEKDFAVVMTLSERCQSLPLVCFDASLRNPGVIMERLVRGLQSTCDEFFYPYLAKRKSQEYVSNGNDDDGASTTDTIVSQTKKLKITTNDEGDTTVPVPAPVITTSTDGSTPALMVPDAATEVVETDFLWLAQLLMDDNNRIAE